MSYGRGQLSILPSVVIETEGDSSRLQPSCSSTLKVRLAGRNFSPLPLQSPESAIWKFAWMNTLQVDEAAALLTKQSPNKVIDGEIMLPSNWAAWREAYRDERDIFSRAYICEALSEDAWIFFEMDLLRFCPICLESGFHSWWHQCRLHGTCLLHGCAIVERCQCCDSRVFLYGDKSRKIQEPYRCKECSEYIAGGEVSFETFSDFEFERPELLARYAPWVRWLDSLTNLWSSGKKISESTDKVDIGRIGRRSARELKALALTCPPPDWRPLSDSGIRIRFVEMVRNDEPSEFDIPSAADYSSKEFEAFADSWSNPSECGPPSKCAVEAVIQSVHSVITSFFSHEDRLALIYCQTNLHDRLRVRAESIRAEVLAAWILELYCYACRPNPIDTQKSELTEADLWRRRIASHYVDTWYRIGNEGLFEVLMALYSELINWLTPLETRRCFDLEVGRLFELLGVSGYGFPPTHLVIIRSWLPWEGNDDFHLTDSRYNTCLTSMGLGYGCHGPHFFSRCTSAFPCRYGLDQWRYMKAYRRDMLADVFRKQAQLFLSE